MAVNALTVVTLLTSFMGGTVGFAPSIDLPTTTPEPTSTTPDPATLPYFPDGTNRSSLTVSVGRAVVLPCRVLRLGDRMVSWVKKGNDKLHLITFGTNTYVSNTRFSLFHDNPDSWDLGITPAQEEDAGVYVCQVSVHPPIGYTVTLNVKVPVLEILDERHTPLHEKFYEVGSSIDLQCVATALGLGNFPSWYKSGTSAPLPTASAPGNVSDIDLSQFMFSPEETRTVTWLRIDSAGKKDSGNYSCSAPNAPQAIVRVHVLEGEDSVAMQHSTNAATAATLGSGCHTHQFCMILTSSVFYGFVFLRQTPTVQFFLWMICYSAASMKASRLLDANALSCRDAIMKAHDFVYNNNASFFLRSLVILGIFITIFSCLRLFYFVVRVLNVQNNGNRLVVQYEHFESAPFRQFQTLDRTEDCASTGNVQTELSISNGYNIVNKNRHIFPTLHKSENVHITKSVNMSRRSFSRSCINS